MAKRQALKEKKENYTREEEFIKEVEKVIEASLEEFMGLPPLSELTKIGARMMLQDAVEEEITAYFARDLYGRTSLAKGRSNGSKPRTVKIGSGDIGIRMPKARNAGGPFHLEASGGR